MFGITVKKSGEGVKEIVTRWLFLVLLGIGLLLAFLQFFGFPEFLGAKLLPLTYQKKFSTGWQNLTMLLLSAGVFSVVLKSMTLMGVFHEAIVAILTGKELREAIREEIKPALESTASALKKELKKEVLDLVYDRQFIEERNDVHEVWNKLTNQMLQDLMPDIHVPIRTEIHDSCFSAGACNYFMEDYELDAKMEFDGTDRLRITETIKFKIVAKDADTEVALMYSTDLPIPSDAGKDSAEIKVLLVDKKEPKPDPIEHVEKLIGGHPRKVLQYNIKLKGQKTYTVERNVVRSQGLWDVKDGPSRGTKFARYVKNFSVLVEYPAELAVSFKMEGAIEGVAKDASANSAEGQQDDGKGLRKGYRSSSNVLHMVYQGIVLPKWGFRYLWHRK